MNADAPFASLIYRAILSAEHRPFLLFNSRPSLPSLSPAILTAPTSHPQENITPLPPSPSRSQSLHMASTVTESWWVLSLSLAAKCGVEGHALNPFSFLLLLLLSCLLVELLFWAVPGGPAWGRYWWRKGYRGGVIPGPRGLPSLGSMSLMSGLAHRHLCAAAKAHGAERLMAFSLGETRAVVTGHPEVAKEILNSMSFTDRPAKESAYGLLFHRAIGFAPYGDYWRTLRRIAAVHLFSPKHVADAEPQRKRIAEQMVAALGISTSSLCVRDVLKEGALYNIMSTVFSERYDVGSVKTKEIVELRSMVEEGYELLGILNWSDHLPLLGSLDLQGIKSRCSVLVPRVYAFVGKIIKEHREHAGATSGAFIDVLLSLQDFENLSDDDIIAVLWEMVFRGTDTVAVLMEWVMARMVMHPEVQEEAQREIDRVVGRARPVEEADVAALAYVQAIVKETLRVHPPGPLLSWARMSIRDTVVDGKLVPAGTTAMVNMWAITRDPHVWEDPNEFRPDRFLAGGYGAGLSIFGSDLRLAPFGSGRRGCPGKALGMATVGFLVASLLHEFEWREPSDKARGVDLSEVLRLSCEMAVPLTVELRPRRR